MRVLVLVAAAAAQYVGQGSDGNPHNWDRARRCDHAGYSPVCGACEGLGGIVWSDKPADFTAPACRKSDLQPDPATLVKPKWGPTTTVQVSHEILIGPHHDPFCFEVFPGNTSAGNNCYKPQTGRISNGLGTPAGALRLDYNQKGPWYTGGNVTSTIYHKGPDMWVVNKLLLGIRQCICTQPTEGFDHGPNAKNVFPLQVNWTDNLRFVARETLEVEYGVGLMELDHYGFGPHHAWVEPPTGTIVRLWQPYNGLQIFEVGKVDYTVDESLFPILPPAECKKGGAHLRIKCTDDGRYVQPKDVAAVEPLERARANTKVPRKAYRGRHHAHMSEVLNTYLSAQTTTKACAEWSVADLRSFVAAMHELRHPEFQEIYNASSDKRRLRDEDMYERWAAVDAAAAPHAGLDQVHRDGLCHEAVMLYVHHLTEDSRAMLHEARVTVPLLSAQPHARPADASDAERTVFGLYEEHVTCQSCHSNVPVPSQVFV